MTDRTNDPLVKYKGVIELIGEAMSSLTSDHPHRAVQALADAIGMLSKVMAVQERRTEP